MSNARDARNRAANIISSDRSTQRTSSRLLVGLTSRRSQLSDPLAQACIEPGRDDRRILGRCVVCRYNIPGFGEGDTCRWCQAKKEQQP